MTTKVIRETEIFEFIHDSLMGVCCFRNSVTDEFSLWETGSGALDTIETAMQVSDSEFDDIAEDTIRDAGAIV